MRHAIRVILALFLVVIYAPQAIPKDTPGTKTQKIDLNNDRVKEIVQIEDKFDTDGVSIVTIAKPKADKIASFQVPGRFNAIEFAELDGDGQKQIVVYYEGKDGSSNLVIYSLKNNKLSKIFTISSPCGIEADLSTILARVRVDKPVCDEEGCYCNDLPNWEKWVWSGERFIKERY